MNNLNDMDICPLLTGNTMEVTRKTKIETDTFELGDIIKFKLADGQKVKAMAVRQDENGIHRRRYEEG